MRRLAAAGLILLVGACSSTPDHRVPAVRVSDAGVALDDTAAVRETLYAQLDDWRGTPYRLGGMTREGVDCSAFVLRVFRDAFGIRLPRTTELQAFVGQPVEDHTAGDLVFFKTGWKQWHVGIYVEEYRFVHASTSQGVILSDLRNPYWAGHYWHTRRLRVD
ncbi:MAG: NlpC/P60 family protein [Salinisphaeraceae bacterium]